MNTHPMKQIDECPCTCSPISGDKDVACPYHGSCAALGHVGRCDGCPAYVPTCIRKFEHTREQGCHKCCDRCNYDRHHCPGCGLPLAHGVEVCEDDAARLHAEVKNPYTY